MNDRLASNSAGEKSPCAYQLSIPILLEIPLPDSSYTLGTETNLTEMRMYTRLRQRYDHNYLFLDPYFPPDSRALIKTEDMSEIFWRRPHELVCQPAMVREGIRSGDVLHGSFGDCHFVAASAATALVPSLREQVIPENQTLCSQETDDKQTAHQYDGIVRFRLWMFGTWAEVIIDDNLPTLNGEDVAYGSSSNDHEFWLPLLKKAYAKIHGGYEGLLGGSCTDVMTDLTGGLVTSFDLQRLPCKESEVIFHRISKALRHGSYVWCGVDGKGYPGSAEREVTIPSSSASDVVSHPFLITGAAKIKLRNGCAEKMLRIENIWEDEFYWNNSWRESIRILPKLDAEAKSSLPQDFASNETNLWLSYGEVACHFRHLYICSLAPLPDQVSNDVTKNEQQWRMSTVRSCWISGYNAGGSANDLYSYAKNPQYLIHLKEPDAYDDTVDHPSARGKCMLQVGLMQEHRKPSAFYRLEQFGLGVRIYRATVEQRECRLQYHHLGHLANVVGATAAYRCVREVTVQAILEPGYYVIVPSTYKPDQSTSYLLRVLTERSLEMIELR